MNNKLLLILLLVSMILIGGCNINKPKINIFPELDCDALRLLEEYYGNRTAVPNEEHNITKQEQDLNVYIGVINEMFLKDCELT